MKKKILAISGSTRAASSGLNLIRAISKLVSEEMEIVVYENLVNLPQFNPDNDQRPPELVRAFKEEIRLADGVLIVTPEYAMGVPGSLKNAIDWTVGSAEFAHKPLALITASTSGEKAHAALLETLQVIEARFTEHSHLIVPFIQTKVNKAGTITDNKTMHEIIAVMTAFREMVFDETSAG